MAISWIPNPSVYLESLSKIRCKMMRSCRNNSCSRVFKIINREM